MDIYPLNDLRKCIKLLRKIVDDIRYNEEWKNNKLAQTVLSNVRNTEVTLLDVADYFDEHPIKEVCVCAAVKTDAGEIYRGQRHGDCVMAMRGRGKKMGQRGEDQGFITSRNRFVDRIMGMRLQLAAGIKSANPGGYFQDNELFSEDLY